MELIPQDLEEILIKEYGWTSPNKLSSELKYTSKNNIKFFCCIGDYTIGVYTLDSDEDICNTKNFLYVDYDDQEDKVAKVVTNYCELFGAITFEQFLDYFKYAVAVLINIPSEDKTQEYTWARTFYLSTTEKVFYCIDINRDYYGSLYSDIEGNLDDSYTYTLCVDGRVKVEKAGDWLFLTPLTKQV